MTRWLSDDAMAGMEQLREQARWEWRCCERSPSPAIGALCEIDFSVRPSIETHFLCEESPHGVAIRHGRLDVKLLDVSRADGLELWLPPIQLPFPVPREKLDILWEAWMIAPPRLRQAAYTASDIVEQVVRYVPDMHQLRVIERRALFTIDGCRAERAIVMTPVGTLETFALEDASPDAVLRALDTCGINRRHHANYPGMLKRLLGLPACSSPRERVAI